MSKEHDPTGKSAIRGQLTRMVLIPSISFLLLWAVLTAAGTIGALRLTSSVQHGRAGIAAFDRLAADLRDERELTQVFLGSGSETARDELLEGRERTDDTFAEERERTRALLGSGGDELTERAREFFETWRALPDLREKVDGGEVGRETALREYTALLSGILLVDDAVIVQLHGDTPRADGFTALELMRAQERFAQADALLSGALAAEAMTYSETAHFTFLTASYRDILNGARPNMASEAADVHQEMHESRSWIQTQDLSLRVVARAPVADGDGLGPAEFNSEIPVEAGEWNRVMADTGPLFQRLVDIQFGSALDEAWASAVRVIAVNAAGCLVTLLAGFAAIVCALRSSRRLIGRLRRLHAETLEVAGARLPAIVAKAQGGGRVDLVAELPPLRHGKDEIGRVADAFNTAQRTAVGAAVKQAEIREGANRVFLGIAYRNQTLVQRQLRLLDEIESAEEDPETLRRLFRLDHLVTRGRRYADNLIILTGARSARRWKDPMPLVDVLRAAMSETEDYERVRLRSAARAQVRGSAVADVTHLLAELVENAAQFSPGDSYVDVGSGFVKAGLAVEVEDRGLGMSAEGYAEANRRLAEPPEFDVMALPDEPRLGLFVVARLAARHGATVRLSPSPYGGTMARTVLPMRLLTVPPQTVPSSGNGSSARAAVEMVPQYGGRS
ncbi:sensor histidine kinase [Actinorugispora endophytica]|uniref:histidine kinase n=1 Tax=Actinorugispora endophytica TaxID=1605990 RepID=A0A4R6UFB0_9ACTN|nr:ATP-binding protein [Actinorugispora endophytica]TDQ45418.1 histidine kinase/DNA gyrase B/HSP90-like ATPase [Actinorugispora endophytica]